MEVSVRRQHRKRINGSASKYVASLDLLKPMTRVDENTGCHLWTGKPNQNGYGRICIDGRDKLAHRLAYELSRGPIPKGLAVCHRCDVRACINPDHLFVATNAENLKDMAAKGRASRGEKHYKAKLTEADVMEIRASSDPVRSIARRYDVDHSLIVGIRKGTRWSHVNE